MLRGVSIILLLSLIFTQDECIEGRYLQEIFPEVNVTNNIFYGSNLNNTFFGDVEQDLYLDVYEPSGDSFTNRPLIILLFGGSYIAGSKTSTDIVELCTSYAKRGYVCSAIDYRLTTELIWLANEQTAYKAAAKGMHDLKGAVRYFRMNDDLYDDFNIDTDRIYAGGVSAGAISAVNAAYLDIEEEIPPFIYDYIIDSGGLEGFSGNEEYSSNFHGVINLCGAVGSTDWISEQDVPIVSLHGTDDQVVPYADGMITLFGLNMSIMGSYSIHNRMIELDNNSSLLTWEGVDHTPFISSSFYMNETIEFSSNFLYDLACLNSFIIGDLNNDFGINILDVIILVNHILEPPAELINAADINDDNILNILDVISLINIILNSL